MLRWCQRVHTWFPGAVDERRRCQSLLPEEGLRLLVPGEPPSIDPLSPAEKIDPAVRGLHECAFLADGIGSCTEGLCCESCVDGGMAAEDVARMEIHAAEAEEESRMRSRPGVKIKRAEEFPPPLGWLVGGGSDDDDGSGSGGPRSRFLKAERRDGRLILTEARIELPPRVFRARREDGRLLLDWIEPEDQEPAAAPPEEEERCGRRIGDGFVRCQEVAIGSGGGGGGTRWWNHRFVTTA